MSLLAVVCMSTLLGLLLVDIQFDVSVESAEIQHYYCSLVKSFGSVSGVSRLAVPCLLLGFAQLCLAYHLSGNLRRLQTFVNAMMIFVGLPSICVSISVSRSACFASPWESHDIICVSHLIMLLLIGFGVLAQAHIVSSLVK